MPSTETPGDNEGERESPATPEICTSPKRLKLEGECSIKRERKDLRSEKQRQEDKKLEGILRYSHFEASQAYRSLCLSPPHTHPFYKKRENGVTHAFCSSCQSALQWATRTQPTEPSHSLPIINTKTRVSWQQIFHSETLYSAVFSSKKKKSNGKGMSLSIVKIFNIARTTAAFHSSLLFKLQLISIYYMKRTARAPGITGMGSQATGRDRESRNAWSVLGCQDRDMWRRRWAPCLLRLSWDAWFKSWSLAQMRGCLGKGRRAHI